MAVEQVSTIYDEVSEKMRTNPEFIADVTALIVEGITKEVVRDTPRTSPMTPQKIQRLAEASATLACSTKDRNKELAYQISHLLVSNYGQHYPGLQAVARLVFSRVGNLPAEDLLPQVSEVSLPLIPAVERVAKRSTNTFRVGDYEYILTDFQATVMQKLSTGMSLSISAPTSAGKSFMLSKFLLSACLADENPFTAVVVVPTRALIHQFFRDLYREFKALEYHQVELISSSFGESRSAKKAIYILTQERLQFLLQKSTVDSLHVDLLIVDEVQNLADEKRGILLESTIVDVLTRSPSAQVVFLAPLARNPQILLGRFNISRGEQVSTLLSPVTQNVFDLTLRDGTISLHLWHEQQQVRILDGLAAPTDVDFDNDAQLVAYLSHLFSGGQPTIVYCNKPEEAESTAYALLRYSQPIQSEKINRFIHFLAEFIHPKYYLIELLQHGIAFHYGNMPEVVRNYVEFLFREKEIKFLCCTSTLLEGVNLPAKNIFIHKPKLGQGDMDDPSFWNLAGRAGRLRMEFSGNVFCINPGDWTRSVPERDRTYELESALTLALRDRNLPSYIADGAVKGKRAHLQQTFSFLITRFMQLGREQLIDSLEQRGVLAGVAPAQVNAVMDSLEQATQEIRLPPKLLKENSGVDPRRIEDLRRYLTNLRPRDLDKLVPLHPSQRDSYENLSNILELTDRMFEDPKREPKYRRDTFLAHSWMREKSLGEIIHGQVSWQLSQAGANADPGKVINKTIRIVISLLNNRIRFIILKHLKCYIDVFAHVVPSESLEEQIEKNLPGYLEVGAYRPVTLALINLGVSRMTAILIANKFPSQEILRDPVDWIRRNRSDLYTLLPDPCRDDLELV